MSKLLKVMLVSAYAALLTRYFQTSSVDREDSIELEYVFRKPGDSKRILYEIQKYGSNMTLREMTTDFEKPERLPTDLKYILKWTDSLSLIHSPTYTAGQSPFINCEFSNCFLTNDKSLLPDLGYYDAVLFDLENNLREYPIRRAPHQYFIFTATESAAEYSICHPSYDSYFNLTWTYKLDSDILRCHFAVLDKAGKRIGPNLNMTWVKNMEPAPKAILEKLRRKKKAAVWYISNCKTKKEEMGLNLSKALQKYSLQVDILGWCGQLTCSKESVEECMNGLKTDYYFYLAFEDSWIEDYVSAKLLFPLLHHSVPIVYGGADYSRFLPPGSYLDASELRPKQLAYKINEAMKTPNIYWDYFRWHNYYVYKEASKEPDFCTLCKKLHELTTKHTVVKNFRQWWNPGYKRICVHGLNEKYIGTD